VRRSDREAERQGEREEKGGDRERRQWAGNIRANTEKKINSLKGVII
jgi:hypothetical protein